jgi:hypothetical protein
MAFLHTLLVIFLSPALKMTTFTEGIKRKPLSVSEKLNIISKADGTPNARRTKIAEELGILVTTLNTVMLTSRRK